MRPSLPVLAGVFLALTGTAGAESVGSWDSDTGDVESAPTCPPEMVLVTSAPGALCMDRYEASKADATGTSAGVLDTSPPKSVPGVIPWIQIGQGAAVLACQSAGKRLCTVGEMAQACGGGAKTQFPYGDAYELTTCHGYGYDATKPTPTGTFEGCVTEDGAFDVIGNVQEWTSTPTSDGEGMCVYGGDYKLGTFSPEQNVEQESCFPESFNCIGFPDPDAVEYLSVGFRCCLTLVPAEPDPDAGPTDTDSGGTADADAGGEDAAEPEGGVDGDTAGGDTAPGDDAPIPAPDSSVDFDALNGLADASDTGAGAETDGAGGSGAAGGSANGDDGCRGGAGPLAGWALVLPGLGLIALRRRRAA